MEAPEISIFAATRKVLHRVGTHVLGRRRHQMTGRFGLRPTPGGFGTPAFGEGPEVVRISGTTLVRETATGAAYVALGGSTLRQLAAFAGADLAAAFDAGGDAPDTGDPDEPLLLDDASARVVAEWFEMGQRALDAVCAALPHAAPAVAQLWPEHFDLGTQLRLPGGVGVNLGASPGDAFSAAPYLYVGPWGDERPGDPEYWNAPFGGVLTRDALGETPDGLKAAVRFFRAGLGLLGATA